MKKKLIAFVCVGMICVSAAQDRKSPAPQALQNGQRYQLFAARVDFTNNEVEGSSNEVFLLDTQTGKVWRFQSTSTVKDGIIPEQFEAVPISDSTGVHIDWNTPPHR
jgi:hypothetical protein